MLIRYNRAGDLCYYDFLFDVVLASYCHGTSLARVNFFLLKLLEALDTTQHASPIVRAHLAPSIIRTKVWDMRLGSVEWLNECEYGRVRCQEGRMHRGYR